MDTKTRNNILKQRKYYEGTAHKYDEMHIGDRDEHAFALAWMMAIIQYYGFKSVLDMGSGTGRAILKIKEQFPNLRVLGIEPVNQLREIGYKKGITRTELIDGDATSLSFSDGEFDLVCEFGVLHHIPNPEVAVSEMLRIAKQAIFISDCNNFGQGSLLLRTFKQVLDLLSLWKVSNFIKTKGKGYIYSEGDGISYSYSVFNNYQQIRKQCSKVHIVNTKDGAINPYRTASHIALLGLKDKHQIV